VRTGDVIEGLDVAVGNDVKVFHAGTALDADGRVVTAGGRVLTVCALGSGLAAAREAAYAALSRLRYDGAFHRRDIAHRALHRH
jgi:phosphoribosylamine--glycine ligase